LTSDKFWWIITVEVSILVEKSKASAVPFMALVESSTAAPTQSGRIVVSGDRTLALNIVRAKTLMAVTGAGLVLFVVAHMLGNLQVFLGQDALNEYAYKLKSMPALLWVARTGLLAIFVGHLALAFYLRQRNREARSESYAYSDPVEASFASRTMLLSGLVIFAFVVYHLLHFTLGVTDPSLLHLTDGQGRHDVYTMVVTSFRNIFVSSAYVIAMLVLGVDLSDAIASIFQTFGFVSAKTRLWIERTGFAVAVLLMIGNISIPAAVWFGFIGLPSGGMTP